MNIKTYEAARTALTKLEAQVKSEAKSDPRLTRGAKRIGRLLAMLKIAQGKYELVHSRKVPAKLAARKAKAKAGVAKKPAKRKTAEIVKLHPKAA
jgi:hypothetical protein